jgi:hypothetical protein
VPHRLPEVELRCQAPHPDFPERRCNKFLAVCYGRVEFMGVEDGEPGYEDGEIRRRCSRDGCHRVNHWRLVPLEVGGHVA